MPIKPHPMKVCCYKCKHTEVFTPLSDCFFLPHCKKCGGEMKTIRSANLLECEIAKLKNIAEKLLNKRKPF